MVSIRRLTTSDPSLLDGLCSLLQDSVGSGASVEFLTPLATATALRYWERVLASSRGPVA